MLDEVRLQEIRRYHEKYYNQSFIRGQGTEVILDYLHSISVKGHWIDLGCGTNTLFWAIPLLRNRFAGITVSDFYPEALHVLRQFKSSQNIPQCYREVMAMYGVEDEELHAVRNQDWEYQQASAFERWSGNMTSRTYALITEFGCFGVAKTGDEFHQAVTFAVEHLEVGGQLIGANWHRSGTYVERYGGDNSFLSEELIERYVSTHNNCEILVNKRLVIEGDELYDYVLFWSIRRK